MSFILDHKCERESCKVVQVDNQHTGGGGGGGSHVFTLLMNSLLLNIHRN